MPELSKSCSPSEPSPSEPRPLGSGPACCACARFCSLAVALAIAALLCASVVSCSGTWATGDRTIEFTRIPPADTGSPDKLEQIEGRVRGARAGERVVLFALSGKWWVQPLLEQPYTIIQKDSTWKSSTHPGVAYAALVVNSQYRPPMTVSSLPEKGGPVLAVATVRGAAPKFPAK